jgi:diguanylate cyclase (GGDEF)-like protein
VYRGEQLFAFYRREADAVPLAFPVAVPPPGQRFMGGQLEVIEPVRVDGVETGRIMVVVETGRVFRSLIRYGLAALVLFALAIGVAYFLLARMRRNVREAEDHLDRLAHADALTGLLNRNGFLAALEAALRRTDRRRDKAALLFADLDDFKLVNDSLGHDAGDALLREVARRLTDRLRDTDVVGRLGGDEFTVMIEGLRDPDEARIVAQMIVQELSSPFDVDGRHVYVGVSVGISIYPDDAPTAPDMLRNADTAMYRAKASGKKSFAFFTPEMTLEQQKRFAIENGLRTALQDGGFHLEYQPQVTLTDGAMFGVEALLRWRDPQFGPLGPAVYLKVAEMSDLIEMIGDWVLREACAQNMRWQAAGLPAVVVAVNVSTRQLRRADFVDRVRSVLEATGLEARFLEIEVTESALMENPAAAVGHLRGLRDMGVHLAIDDFGTGYSSLSYLQRLPIEKLKIDKAFVRDMISSPADASIARAIVAMGASLKLLTLAEGVETADVAASLREMGCWAAQGYFFGRPVPAEDIAELLRRGSRLPEATAMRLAGT